MTLQLTPRTHVEVHGVSLKIQKKVLWYVFFLYVDRYKTCMWIGTKLRIVVSAQFQYFEFT